jgi:LacI family transcriptional regulator
MDFRTHQRRIAVLVEADDAWGASVLRGVADYAQRHGPWSLLVDPRDNEERPALPDAWSGDGVIARFSSPRQLEQIRSRGVPAVNVDTLLASEPNIAHVVTDDGERAAIAFQHLRDRGFERFAYFAPPSHRYSDRLGREFAARVEAAGFVMHEYRPPLRGARKLSWDEQQRRVTQWLDALPRPIAVLTVDAYRARRLVEICTMVGIRVPDQMAILAGDADELICEIATPPLSSVVQSSRRIGYEAAAMLDRLMNGEPAPLAPIRIAPQGVVARQSTNVLAIDDPTVVQALRFIQAAACQDIVVKDILAEVPVSRRSLEIQFRRCLGRSPAEEIRRVRLDRGCELLARSDLSIAEIAASCGFANGTRFGVAFRKRFGKTPLAYRKQLARG